MLFQEMDILYSSYHTRLYLPLWTSQAEVAGVIFSDPDSAPVPTFLNPDPGPCTGAEIFQL